MRIYKTNIRVFHAEHNGRVWEVPLRDVVVRRDSDNEKFWSLYYDNGELLCPINSGYKTLRDAIEHTKRVYIAQVNSCTPEYPLLTANRYNFRTTK